MTRPSLLNGNPRQWLVHDDFVPCPYLAGRTARMPMRLPTRPLNRRELGQHLAAGDRRQGLLLYQPRCPTCQACEPIRIDVAEFRPSKSQRRVLRRADAVFRITLARPTVTWEKVDLYNEHKIARDLVLGGDILDAESYQQFLAETCTDTFEMQYRVDDRLAAVAVVDRAADALSAVYCYYDPAVERLSPGTYSILKQVELCRAWGLRYLYLGLFVAGSPTMAYKAGFLPHQRRIDGEWVRFDRVECDTPTRHAPGTE